MLRPLSSLVWRDGYRREDCVSSGEHFRSRIMTKSYQITNEQSQIVIRLDSHLIDSPGLSRLLDYIELEMVRNRSRLTEDQASDLADEIDRGVWNQVKHKYLEK